MINLRYQSLTNSPEFYKGTEIDLWIQDGILCYSYKVKEIDLHVAIRATEERIAFANGRDMPVVVDYRNVESTTREARKYFASERPALHVESMAIIISSIAGELAINFFAKIDRPKYQLQSFTNFHAALDWATSFKPTHA